MPATLQLRMMKWAASSGAGEKRTKIKNFSKDDDSSTQKMTHAYGSPALKKIKWKVMNWRMRTGSQRWRESNEKSWIIHHKCVTQCNAIKPGGDPDKIFRLSRWDRISKSSCRCRCVIWSKFELVWYSFHHSAVILIKSNATTMILMDCIGVHGTRRC